MRGADGIERQYSGGWIEGKNSPPVLPKEWRYMIEDERFLFAADPGPDATA